MTTNQKPDREAVKTLAIAIGVRQAARKLGLNEDTVCSWAKRGAWFTPKPLPPSQAIIPQALQAKPSDALATLLKEDSDASKIGFSKASRKAAESLAEHEADKLLDKDTAQAAKHWHGIASGTHQWEEKQVQSNVMVNIALLGVQPDQIQVKGETIELNEGSETDQADSALS